MAGSDTPFVTPIDIPLERSLYIGAYFQGIMYGMEIVTFFMAIYCIRQRPSHYRKRQGFYLVHGGVLLSLATISMSTNAVWGQYMWVDHRNYPGGPLGYYAVSQDSWYNNFGFVTDVMANILGDGLLVYRCFIIWDSQWHAVVLPVLIYLASSVISIITVVEIAKPGAVMLSGMPIHLTVPWASLSVSLNVIVTSMICFRLLRMRARAREVLPPGLSSMYTSIAAMLIESAAPFSILGIGLVVTAAQNGPLVFAFGYVWTMLSSLSPQMIILRVAMGHAWLKETVTECNTTLVFAESAATHEQSQEVQMTIYNDEVPISLSGMPEDSSDLSVSKHMSVAGAVTLD